MKTLTIEQVETLKNVCWEKENETSFSFIPDIKTFTELTDYDVGKWAEDTQSADLSIKYQTPNITGNDIPYFAEVSMSWGEVAFWQGYFTKLAKRYGLIKEFRENAII